MRSAILGSVVLLLATASACTPGLTDGRYACASDETCPPGWTCSGGRCYSGSGVEECRLDAHCDDGSACTLDICQGVRCTHEPDASATECDNGSICDGADTCNAGECVPSGVAPCDPCDETGGCANCGGPGLPCCDGVCLEGSVCDAMGSCVPCGVAAALCCSELDCPFEPRLTCVGDRCEACGNADQPCCDGTCTSLELTCSEGICVGGSTCGCPDGSACTPEGGCASCGGMWQLCCGEGGCNEGAICVSPGVCVPGSCGARDEACCEFGPACGPQLYCVSGSSGMVGTTTSCQPCGRRDAQCCDPGSGEPPCQSGLICEPISGFCDPCGGLNQRCCGPDDTGACNDPETWCNGGFCRDCGDADERCCVSSPSCMPGLSCGATGCA